MKSLRRIAIVALVMALVAIPTAAFAFDEGTTPTTETDRATTDRPDTDERRHRDLSEIKARALEMIDKQLEILAGLRSKIANARHITDDHATQLLRDISTAADGLSELARKIEAATTVEELRELIEHIDDFKIRQVLAPKTHQVIGSDSLVYATGKLERFSAKLSEITARFEDAGFDVDEAWRLLEEMDANIAEAYRLASPVAENVIGLQAADWPDPAESVLSAGRADLRAAGQDVKTAHRIGGEIVHFLRGLIDGSDVAFDVAGIDVATG